MSPTRRRRRTAWRLGLPTATILAVLIVWEILSRTGAIPQRYAPGPTSVAGALVGLAGTPDMWLGIWNTLVSWAVSLALAAVVGTLVGLALGSSRTASALLAPIIAFLRPIPSVALIPIAVFLIGTSARTGVFLATYAALWQMIIGAVGAAGSIDPVARETASAYSLPRGLTFRTVILRSMAPGIATSLRIASTTALVLSVTTELLVGAPGLGAELSQARGVGDLPDMYAYIVIIGILGSIITLGFQAGEKRVLFWDPANREEQTA